MNSKWQFLLWRITRQTWFRSTLYCVLGAVTAIAALIVGPFVPTDYADRIGAGSVDTILTILASSMLAVATFSLTTMVSAYNAASNSTTPRAATLLIEDSTSHNALATFIGAFLFSVVGIVLLSTRVYGGGGRLVLLAATIAVIVIVVATLLGWINKLSRLGRVGETIDEVEKVAQAALVDLARAPWMGGCALDGLPEGAAPVHVDRVAYVQHVDLGRLQEIAESHDLQIHAPARPGTFVEPERALMYVSGKPDESAADSLKGAFTLAGERTFVQDPRFCLIALSEIASRALSPGVNDPGTAIDVVGTLVRLLVRFDREASESQASPAYDRIHVEPLSMDDLILDGFRPIARDGAGNIEVSIRLRKALLSLAACQTPDLAKAAARMADDALARAAAGLVMEQDVADLRAVQRISTRFDRSRY
ncbi:DUF2254 domain-containing protein [Emcibacter sp. SYSU 3D8]|uniref:DUF2254 domain-containing protein n=1 Tax=Emcibacter sp. SYSU 3D8 TaxID=3133969 RepID=UPI0031FF0636